MRAQNLPLGENFVHRSNYSNNRKTRTSTGLEKAG